ncbi:PAS domain-containing protein [Nonomuraea antimicrobica]
METSDRVADEERHELSGELVRALFHGLRVGIYIVDADGKIIMVNPTAERLLGRSAGELIGADSHDLLHRNADGSPIPREDCPHLAAVSANTSVRTDEAYYTLGGGGLIALGLSIAPMRLGKEGGRGGAVLLYDLSRHKAVEREQAAHLTALERLTGRLWLMSEITTVLASTLEVKEALRRLSRLVVPRLADWAVIDLLDQDGTPRRVAVVSRHAPGGGGGGGAPLPRATAARSPLVRVLHGAPALLLGAQDLAGLDDDAICARSGLLAEIEATSLIIAPLGTPRRVLGALTLARCGPSPAYDESDLAFLREIAARAGLAVDNAEMYEQQRRIAETMQRHLIAPIVDIEELEVAVRYRPAPPAPRSAATGTTSSGSPAARPPSSSAT